MFLRHISCETGIDNLLYMHIAGGGFDGGEYVPKSATISLAEKPLFEKAVKISVRSILGNGILASASLKLAVVESLLPNSTIQAGPPN